MKKKTENKTTPTTEHAIAVDTVLCGVIIEYKNPVAFSGYIYEKCGRVAKYRIKYKEATRGKIVEKCVCGIHFKAAQKNSLRLKNKLNYDTEFTWRVL